MESFLATILMFAGNFAPRGWALCNGQLLPISQNQALFSILGTSFGGNGQTTFGLPDFQGRMPLHWGNGAGGTYIIGQQSGSISTNILINNMPSHNHALLASTAAGSSAVPTGNFLANTGALDKEYATTANTAMATTAVNFNGGSQPLPVQNPYLAVTFIICLEGIFPSRN